MQVYRIQIGRPDNELVIEQIFQYRNLDKCIENKLKL